MLIYSCSVLLWSMILLLYSCCFFLDFINRKINYDRKDCCSHETAKLVAMREIRSPMHIVLGVEQDSVRGKPPLTQVRG